MLGAMYYSGQGIPQDYKEAAKGYHLAAEQGNIKAQALLGDPRLIIVDEPTAGLDPTERHRFNNLLAEIGENVVVILSTHIVDDVCDLCPLMAVSNGGKIAAKGAPSELVAELRGKVWRKSISKDELSAVTQAHQMLRKRFVSGSLMVDILADDQPEGFTEVEPELEHAYFKITGAEKE